MDVSASTGMGLVRRVEWPCEVAWGCKQFWSSQGEVWGVWGAELGTWLY